MSLGTGVPPPSVLRDPKLLTVGTFVGGMVSAATDSETVHHQLETLSKAMHDVKDSDKYFRFNLGQTTKGEWVSDGVVSKWFGGSKTWKEPSYVKLLDLADVSGMKALSGMFDHSVDVCFTSKHSSDLTSNYMNDKDNTTGVPSGVPAAAAKCMAILESVSSIKA